MFLPSTAGDVMDDVAALRAGAPQQRPCPLGADVDGEPHAEPELGVVFKERAGPGRPATSVRRAHLDAPPAAGAVLGRDLHRVLESVERGEVARDDRSH